jgi:hypothetical protein
MPRRATTVMQRLAVTAVLCLSCAKMLCAQTTVLVAHSYDLTQSYFDQAGGPSLVSLGGTLSSVGYTFAANQGLQLATPLTDPGHYTIELNFAFDNISGYRKILDFKSLGPDSGFYFYYGNLNFYPAITSGQVDTTAGQPVEVVLSRDSATQQFTGYVNGTQVITFSDTTGLAVLSSPATGLYFFIDDAATGQRESSGGVVTKIRIFDTVLQPAEVLSLAQDTLPLSVPEPSTITLLALGLGAIALNSWRQRKFRA